MLTNVLKMTLRNLKRRKGYSFINIGGLAFGMACCILIIIWVMFELRYDQFHLRADRIYRLGVELTIGSNTRISAAGSAPMIPALIDGYAEVKNGVRLFKVQHIPVEYQDRKFYEEQIIYADNSLFDVFSLSIISGNKESALTGPYTVILTKEAAQKYFADEDPVGKIMTLNHSDSYTVTGVVERWPDNSHLQFDFLCSFDTLLRKDPINWERWGRFAAYSYLLLEEGTDIRSLESKFPDFVETHMGDLLKRAGARVRLFLQPLTHIHLFSDLEAEISENGSITTVIVFSAIAFAILLIACINFVNLTTARSAHRAREVSIRKVCGASKAGLSGRFLTESVIYATFALLLAVILVYLALPYFSAEIGRTFNLSTIPWEWFLPVLLLLGVLVGLVSGFYPAFFLSFFDAAAVLKSGGQKGSSRYLLRRILVVFQFTVSTILIVAVLTVFAQIRFMKNSALGFNKERVVVIPGLDEIPNLSVQTLREMFIRLPGVLGASASNSVPGSDGRMTNFLPEGFEEDESLLMMEISVDEHFIPVMGVNVIAGRNFSTDFGADLEGAAIINKTAAERIGQSAALGKAIRYRTPGKDGKPVYVSRTIVGIVEDFHLGSLHRCVEPLFMGLQHRPLRMMSIRLAPGEISKMLDRLERTWHEILPDQIFDYYFLDESFDEQYRAEERMNWVISHFSLLAVVIACLGLWGLSAYMIEQRTKEVGIRKVLGASNRGIAFLLSREFLILIALSNIFAWPAAFFTMNRWLENFAYRTPVNLIHFFLAGLMTVSIALATVSMQTLKLALSNPVNALKYE